MSDYNVIYSSEFKSDTSNKEIQDNVADQQQKMSDNPQYKVIIPQYMYKPAWGFPRYQPLSLLRALGKNVYASSVFKAIKDIITDTEWKVLPKREVELTPDLKKKIDKYTSFFEKPNPEDTFNVLIRKILDDLFKYDSGVINKVFNQFEELIQLRAAPGDTFKKNPNKHGYLDERDEVIFDKGPMAGRPVSNDFIQSSAYQFYTNFIDKAAYFQFVNSVASQIPIPYGKREICWLTTNPSTDNVYTNGAPLEDCIDLILTLVYGLKFNLDFYANGNTPEGIINAVGATKKDLKKISSQLSHSIDTPTDGFGLKRRIGYRMPVVNMDNIEFVKLNLTSKEMEILDQQGWFTKVLWMRFGLNADEMGFTDDSNRATSTQQTKNAIRKAIKPMYTLIEECFTYEILPEFEDGELLEFKFDFYDPIEQKGLRDLQQQEMEMGINSAEKIMDEEGIDKDKVKAGMMEAIGFDIETPKETRKEETKEEEQQVKDEANLKKEKEKPEAKSMTADIGGEGTEDSVMNPVNSPKKQQEIKTIVKRGDKWLVMNKEKTKVLGTHSTEQEALDQLQAIEANKSYEDKGEYKGHPGTELQVEMVEAHTHEVFENDNVSSYDDGHRHKVDWHDMKLFGADHEHNISRRKIMYKSKDLDNKNVQELPKKGALDVTMNEYKSEFEKLVKEVIKKA
jgi:hypothetical protein